MIALRLLYIDDEPDIREKIHSRRGAIVRWSGESPVRRATVLSMSLRSPLADVHTLHSDIRSDVAIYGLACPAFAPAESSGSVDGPIADE
jgi:hypothetical protein